MEEALVFGDGVRDNVGLATLRHGCSGVWLGIRSEEGRQGSEAFMQQSKGSENLNEKGKKDAV